MHLDAYATRFDVTDTLAVPVRAGAPAVWDAIRHADCAAPARALSALGPAGRVVLPPSRLAAEEGRELVLGAIWRADGRAVPVAASEARGFAAPGHVVLAWNLRVEPGAFDRAFLSSMRRFTATDADTRERLLASWGSVDALARGLARRTLDAVRLAAEDAAEAGRPVAGGGGRNRAAERAVAGAGGRNRAAERAVSGAGGRNRAAERLPVAA